MFAYCYSSYPLATVLNKYVHLIVVCVLFIQDFAHQFLSKSVNICWSYAQKYFYAPQCSFNYHQTGKFFWVIPIMSA